MSHHCHQQVLLRIIFIGDRQHFEDKEVGAFFSWRISKIVGIEFQDVRQYRGGCSLHRGSVVGILYNSLFKFVEYQIIFNLIASKGEVQ